MRVCGGEGDGDVVRGAYSPPVTFTTLKKPVRSEPVKASPPAAKPSVWREKAQHLMQSVQLEPEKLKALSMMIVFVLLAVVLAVLLSRYAMV